LLPKEASALIVAQKRDLQMTIHRLIARNSLAKHRIPTLTPQKVSAEVPDRMILMSIK
jgi:hypothetical protein